MAFLTGLTLASDRRRRFKAVRQALSAPPPQPREILMAVYLVLSVSRDAALAETRRQIMKELGCIVETVSTPVEAMRAFRDGDFDLVLLCQTITQEEKRKLVARRNARSSSTEYLGRRAFAA